jgi:hypothetical protein
MPKYVSSRVQLPMCKPLLPLSMLNDQVPLSLEGLVGVGKAVNEDVAPDIDVTVVVWCTSKLVGAVFVVGFW